MISFFCSLFLLSLNTVITVTKFIVDNCHQTKNFVNFFFKTKQNKKPTDNHCLCWVTPPPPESLIGYLELGRRQQQQKKNCHTEIYQKGKEKLLLHFFTFIKTKKFFFSKKIKNILKKFYFN